MILNIYLCFNLAIFDIFWVKEVVLSSKTHSSYCFRLNGFLILDGSTLAVWACFSKSKALLIKRGGGSLTHFSKITHRTSVFNILKTKSTELFRENFSNPPDLEDDTFTTTSFQLIVLQPSRPNKDMRSPNFLEPSTSHNWKFLSAHGVPKDTITGRMDSILREHLRIWNQVFSFKVKYSPNIPKYSTKIQEIQSWTKFIDFSEKVSIYEHY